MRQLFKRELDVAFSLQGQPLWFRITKWIVFIGVSRKMLPVLRRSGRHRLALWGWFAGLPLAGLALHGFYRRQTKGWTQPRGGWNDLAGG